MSSTKRTPERGTLAVGTQMNCGTIYISGQNLGVKHRDPLSGFVCVSVCVCVCVCVCWIQTYVVTSASITHTHTHTHTHIHTHTLTTYITHSPILRPCTFPLGWPPIRSPPLLTSPHISSLFLPPPPPPALLHISFTPSPSPFLLPPQFPHIQFPRLLLHLPFMYLSLPVLLFLPSAHLPRFSRVTYFLISSSSSQLLALLHILVSSSLFPARFYAVPSLFRPSSPLLFIFLHWLHIYSYPPSFHTSPRPSCFSF